MWAVIACLMNLLLVVGLCVRAAGLRRRVAVLEDIVRKMAESVKGGPERF